MKSRVLLPLARIGHNMFLFRRPECAERSQYQGKRRNLGLVVSDRVANLAALYDGNNASPTQGYVAIDDDYSPFLD